MVVWVVEWVENSPSASRPVMDMTGNYWASQVCMCMCMCVCVCVCVCVAASQVMAKKIDAAADNGVDHFIFDWYWYNETGGTFQDGALEDGFLKAPNRHRLEFSLMWASQVS